MHTGINRGQAEVDERVDLHKAIHRLPGSCSGWRYGAVTAVSQSAAISPGHFN